MWDGWAWLIGTATSPWRTENWERRPQTRSTAPTASPPHTERLYWYRLLDEFF
jgi:hypothetical protein